MYHSPHSFLQHILTEIEYLLHEAARTDHEKFIADETLKRAFTRSLEIIGEATKQLSSQFRDQHPTIDWRAMTGMRDKLIHGYFTIDYDIVWRVVIQNLPSLREQIRELIDDPRSELPKI